MVSKETKPYAEDCICKFPCPLFVTSGVSPAGKLLFGVIYGNFEREGKPVVMTNERLSQLLTISPRTVRSEIKNLEDRGMLVVKQGKKRLLQPNLEYEWDYAQWERVAKILTGEIPYPEDEENNLYALKSVPEDVLHIITYWNTKIALKPVKIPNKVGDKFEMTPTFAGLIKVIKELLGGKMFNAHKSFRFYHDKPWTVDEVKQSIDNFNLAATCEDYYPTSKESCLNKTLGTFIFNPYIKDPKWKSSLVMYVEPPKPFLFGVKVEEAKSIPSYLSIKKEVIETFLLNKEPTKEQDMKIIAISNRFQEWFERGKKSLPSMPMSSQWAGYVVEAALGFTQSKGQYQYDPLDTMRREWFWDAFTRFMQKKGLLSTYSLK